MAENKTLEHLPEVRAAVAALSPEDRELLAAVQASPFKLTAPEQFKEFADNIDYFVFEPNIHDLNDLGWRYLAQHMDMLLPPELLKAIVYFLCYPDGKGRIFHAQQRNSPRICGRTENGFGKGR